MIATGWLTFIIIIAVFFAIGGVSLVIYFAFLRPRLKKDDKPTEEQIVQEEMNRILKPIEDDETAKAVSEYKDEEE